MCCPNCGCAVLNAYVLLDRSGSMQSRWTEAIGSVNAYAEGLAKGSAKVTLATFDTFDGLKFEVIRDAVPANEWKPVTNEDATPRGFTPLFDAIGRVVLLAETAGNEKTVIVVMTDGAENESREITKEGARAALDRCKAKGWEVVFLGADFNAFGEAANVGLGTGKVLNMRAGNYFAATRRLSEKSMAYAASNEAVTFNDQDRAEAAASSE